MSLEVCSIALGTSWPWNYSLPIDCSTDYTSLYSPISNIRVVTKCTISLVDIWLEKLLKLRYSSTANHWLLWSDTLNLFLRDFKELEFYILTISGIRAWVCGGTVGRRYYKSVSVITSVYRNYCDQKSCTKNTCIYVFVNLKFTWVNKRLICDDIPEECEIKKSVMYTSTCIVITLDGRLVPDK